MRRAPQALRLAALVACLLAPSQTFAQDAAEAEEEEEVAKPAEKAASVAPAAPAADAAPTPAPAPAPAADTPADASPKPKFGDTTVSGYLRGGFGASNQKGRMTCFSLAIPGGLVAKYRLGNECEVWSETEFKTVVYAGNDGAVATAHFMPTVYIPTTYNGYSPNNTVSSPALFTTSTGSTVSFPNLYVDLKGVPWLFGGTVWAGTRYYKRESVYINDFFYWNPSGVGGGVEDVNLGKDLRLSYAAFAVDGEPAPPPDASSPPQPAQADFGIRHDIQLRGIRPWSSGEFQVGVQLIANYSNNPDTHGGWGATVQYVQKLLGGENKLAFQYGRGGGTGFGTLSRFYYPDFSLYFSPTESRYRIVDVVTVQPTDWLGGQATIVYQHDDLGNEGQKTNWLSLGARVGAAFTEHAKILGEVGYDKVKKSNGSDPQFLAKFTIAPAITASRGFMARPEFRLFYTWAMWNETARGATVDSGRLYTTTDKLSGSTFGLQGETWW